MLVTSLGLEATSPGGHSNSAGPVGKGQGQQQQQTNNNKKQRANSAEGRRSATPCNHSAHDAGSEPEMSDSFSSGVSSGSGSPDPRIAVTTSALVHGGSPSPLHFDNNNKKQQQQQQLANNHNMENELDVMRAEMVKANATIAALQEREKKLKAK